jgi:hypothetical protein
MKQINNLDKRELRELICFFQYIGDTTWRQLLAYEPRSELSLEKEYAGSLNLNFSLSRTVRNEFLSICKSLSLFLFNFFSLLFLVYLFIYSYVLTLFSHLSPRPPIPFSPPHLTSRQKLFCTLLQFCGRENISNNNKDMVFLLVWDKDSYTERFLALLPCTCVL